MTVNGMMIEEAPHRRYNPLTGEWILVCPHRTRRPWRGKREAERPVTLPGYDPGCYLCPGNLRAGGERNPEYQSTFVFTNDFSALLPDTSPFAEADHPLIQYRSIQGTCRVVCFSPRHDLTLPEMGADGIRSVIDVWIEESKELGKRYSWVQVFENKGEIMGCSNPHPHGQIWAGSSLPLEAGKEDARQAAYRAGTGRQLLMDYLEHELELRARIVSESKNWVAVVPFWAVWPFESLLLPRRHMLRLVDLVDEERRDLAQMLGALLTRYDNLFEASFPYTMGWHGAPFQSRDVDHWQLHAHFFPPLLRSAAIKKFMVGYEMLAEPQRDITPELAAGQLRAASEIHYKLRRLSG